MAVRGVSKPGPLVLLLAGNLGRIPGVLCLQLFSEAHIRLKSRMFAHECTVFVLIKV